MKKIFTLLAVFTMLLSAMGYSQQPAQKPALQPLSLAITHVTVIDATGTPAQPHMTVVITGDRIVAIGKTGKVKLPKAAQRLNASGKFLIPGLWDMHVHLLQTKEFVLPLFIANGVTSVREMGGDFTTLQAWRKRSSEGETFAPRIKAAGTIIESAAFVNMVRRISTLIKKPNNDALLKARLGVANPDEAKQAVQTLAKMGVDFVKFRTSPSRETYLAMAEEAKRAGLTFVGHAPTVVNLIEASDAGQKSIEHSLDTLINMSDTERQAVYARFVKNGTAVVPTLIAMKGYRLTPDSQVDGVITDTQNTNDARRKYLSWDLLDFWDTQIKLKKFESPADWKKLAESHNQNFREMHKAGVRIMAGTDIGAPLVYPGFSVHEELELLVSEIGLTAMEALQSATRNPAAFFGIDDSLGTIEQGKLADLVLLEANPLASIGNTKKIAAVVLSGKYLSKAALQKLLIDVESAATKDRKGVINK